jgi:hypothetical protein
LKIVQWRIRQFWQKWGTVSEWLPEIDCCVWLVSVTGMDCSSVSASNNESKAYFQAIEIVPRSTHIAAFLTISRDS